MRVLHCGPGVREEHLKEAASVLVQSPPFRLQALPRPSLSPVFLHTRSPESLSPDCSQVPGWTQWAGLDCICEVMSPPSGSHPGLRPGPSPLSGG